MLVTIVVPDNIVSVDGRVLPIDCSAIDGNIRVIQWYDTWGTIEFMNAPGNVYKANGRLDSFSDYHDYFDQWQTLALKLDAVPMLQDAPPHMAIDMLLQIESQPALSALPIDEATDKLRKIQIDGDLDINTLGLDECVRLYDIIQGEPKLLAVYPGKAVQLLQQIEADPTLNAMPLGDAVEQINPPPPPPPAPLTLNLQANYPPPRELPPGR